MKKMFFILFACMLAFTACDKDDNGVGSGTDSGNTSSGGGSNSSGKLSFKNRSDFSARVSVQGLGTYNVTAGGTYNIENVPAGTYSITYEQTSHYPFGPAIVETTAATVNNYHTTEVSFPDCYTGAKLANTTDYQCTFTISRAGYGSKNYVVNPGYYQMVEYLPSDGNYTIESLQNSGYILYPDRHEWTYSPTCGYYSTFDHSATKSTQAPVEIPAN